MAPIIGQFELFDRLIEIPSYGLFMMLSAITVIALGYFFSRRVAPKKTLFLFILAVVPITIIGARLMNVLTNLSLYGEPEDILRLSARGFSLMGGLLAATALAFVLCDVLSINFLRLADSMAPPVGVGIAVYRIGCFLNGCCFGKSTTLPWGVRFPLGSPANLYQISQGMIGVSDRSLPVHPTELYELGASLVGAYVAYRLLRLRKRDGTAASVFVIWFSAFRWVNMAFRADPPTWTAPNWFYPALYGGLIASAILFILVRGSKWRGNI